MNQLPNKFMGILPHPVNMWVHSFTELDISDTDNIVPFKIPL